MEKHADRSTALWVLRRLRQAGHEAYFAGGCVRDMLLKLRSTDYDIATSATPDEVKKLFRHVLLVGAKFGVAMVVHHRRLVEVTTFRCDVSYADGRRPESVRFTSLREDALRRDFTINGMYYDPIDEMIIDIVGGRDDLSRRVVRTIGDPAERFAEDYLRMIRAVRFAERFAFAIDPATAQAVRTYAPKITQISGERIFDELSKMLSRETAAQAMGRLAELELAPGIVPEMFAGRELWTAAVERVAFVARRCDGLLALAAMLLELERDGIVRIVRRWGASNEIRDAAVWMAAHRDEWRRAADMPLCELKRLMANPHFNRLRTLWRFEEHRETGGASLARRIARRCGVIDAAAVAPPPLVTGADLKKLGLREGPRLGKLLVRLYDAQLNEEIASHNQALDHARRWIQDPE